MKNSEKYTTPEARLAAFDSFCKVAHEKDKCHLCEIVDKCDCCQHRGMLYWLEMEAECEKPLPCPYCGSAIQIVKDEEFYTGKCTDRNEATIRCPYQTPYFCTKEALVSEHNFIAKAVMTSKNLKWENENEGKRQ